jgi:hypothetical protein
LFSSSERLRLADNCSTVAIRFWTCAEVWTESFIGTLKNEMLQNGCFINEQDARTEIFDYIESHYNIHRKHSALRYISPAQFEAQTISQN